MQGRGNLAAALMTAVMLLASGCTTLGEWLNNGCKVGPSYREPPAAVAPNWLQAEDPRLQSTAPVLCDWWAAFNDPKLSSLIEIAYRENLDLQKAAYRIVEAHANRNMVAGELFPQRQGVLGAYVHGQISETLQQGAFPQLFNLWLNGPAISWELDLWGKFRRAREAADAELDASIDNYHDVLVLLLADVATNYIQIRTLQQELQNVRENLVIQRKAMTLARSRFQSGKTSEQDVQQALTNLERTESTVAPLQTGLQQANNRICILRGMTPRDLTCELGTEPIPSAPATIAVGVPSELLRRRPDVRRSERAVAAQCAQIGVAEADFYPSFSLSGFLGYSGDQFVDLFRAASFTGIIAPNVEWKILHYGRIENHVRVEEARLNQRIRDYQQTVLRAGREAEDSITAALGAQEQIRHLSASLEAAERSVTLALIRYEEGKTDFTPVALAIESLTRAQDLLAEAKQDLAINLVRIYKALGGGYEAFPCCPDGTPRPHEKLASSAPVCTAQDTSPTSPTGGAAPDKLP
jgi:NodT family efflux transporter outer membrane factor (OMF) lipoprotein